MELSKGDRVRYRVNCAPHQERRGIVVYASPSLVEVEFDDGSGYRGDPGPIERLKTYTVHGIRLDLS